MCKSDRNRPYVPPGVIMKTLVIALAITVATAFATAASAWNPAQTGGTAPAAEPSEFPTNLTDDEVAAIQAWNAWFFEREQAYKDAMYEQWKVQMGDDAEWLFGSFEESLGDKITDLALKVNSLDATSRANLDAAVKLQGYVATPEPIVVTEIVEVPVEIEKIVEVPVETIVEVPVEVIVEVIVEVPVGDPVEVVREPSRYEYCAWLETEMRRLRDTGGNGIDADTYATVMIRMDCEEVGLDI